MSAYYNDIDPYCCAVIRARMDDGLLPVGDIDDRDICEVRADDLRGYQQVHLFCGIGGFPLGLRLAGIPDEFPIWTGGFPCQDISVAGRGAGIEGARSGLWNEHARLLREARPVFAVVENTPALLGRGLGRILGDLAASGLDAWWDCIPASSIGAHHRRDRLWIVAYPASGGCKIGERLSRSISRALAAAKTHTQWPDQSGVDRTAYGLPGRVDRVRALGNSVVPQVVAVIGRAILNAVEEGAT